ncbi:DUF559 domain-containing protein [Micromonospora echinofusca]|uniref:DUF559 domain-containing protein n=1 Tax=Micromonospora echinofusca TaxID=47858 RepID=A0ABS3W294_MICEH|nr:DUF559 domain-containing protein [Micromonospora echinofusca]MBO4210893.1 DUF559 domain-containing protein [Micromonospora echinofusca]
MSRTLWQGSALIGAMSRKVVRHRVERGELLRIRRGVYADGPADEEDQLRALFLQLPAESVLARQSAARRQGFGVLREDAVHIQLPQTVARPRLPGVAVHHAVLPLPEPVMVDGIPCVPPARCAVDLARTVRRIDALPVLDAALRTGLVTPDHLLAEVGRHRGLRGVCQARQLVPYADGRAECRQESQLRLVLVDGGLPVPEPQIWVPDEAGVPLYRLDLGYRKRRVGIEYDGVSHLDRDRLRHDRARMNWLAAQGWAVRYFTDRDLYRRPGHVVQTVAALLCP